MKKGGNWDRHTKALGHGGREKPNFKPMMRKRSCGRPGNAAAGLLGRINAVATGFGIGASAVGEMSRRGAFDETLNWSYVNEGEMCSEYPAVPMVSEANVLYQFAVADISGPLYGLGGSGRVRYELLKEVHLRWSCCCSSPTRRKEVVEEKSAGPFYDDWLGGFLGEAQYSVFSIEFSVSQDCD